MWNIIAYYENKKFRCSQLKDLRDTVNIFLKIFEDIAGSEKLLEQWPDICI